MVLIASLGYFVDIYDLVLFNMVERDSLEYIVGPNHASFKRYRNILYCMQMAGMLIGSLLWGIFSDKKGRVTVLFGSILMYSLANVANAFVSNINSYALIRFLAGIGLAGELGAGIYPNKRNP